MKKYLITFGILAIMALIAFLGEKGILFGGPKIQTQAQIEAIINQKEADYFQAHGTYFQILCGKRIPSDRTYTWNELFANTITNNAYDICIDVWGGPDGQGYRAIVIDTTIPPPEINQTSSTTPE